MNVKHKEVGLQSRLKLVMSKVSGLFTGTSQEIVTRTLSVINTVAGNDRNIGFRDKITGTGTLLGSVMVLDLDIPLGWNSVRPEDERRFNENLARALNREFGSLASVGYVSPEATRTSTVKVQVETEATYPETEVRNALRNVGEVTIL